MSPGTDEAHTKRQATVYDAVAGRIGSSGFLKPEELKSSRVEISAPEEVLLRRVNAPDTIPYDYYNSDERLDDDQELPDSDLLTAFHAYASDFYKAATPDSGILLEEAALEALGETGDMALTEPEGLEHGLLESMMTTHQIIGKVKPAGSPTHVSDREDDDDEDAKRPPKRRK